MKTPLPSYLLNNSTAFSDPLLIILMPFVSFNFPISARSFSTSVALTMLLRFFTYQSEAIYSAFSSLLSRLQLPFRSPFLKPVRSSSCLNIQIFIFIHPYKPCVNFQLISKNNFYLKLPYHHRPLPDWVQGSVLSEVAANLSSGWILTNWIV